MKILQNTVEMHEEFVWILCGVLFCTLNIDWWLGQALR